MTDYDEYSKYIKVIGVKSTFTKNHDAAYKTLLEKLTNLIESSRAGGKINIDKLVTQFENSKKILGPQIKTYSDFIDKIKNYDTYNISSLSSIKDDELNCFINNSVDTCMKYNETIIKLINSIGIKITDINNHVSKFLFRNELYRFTDGYAIIQEEIELEDYEPKKFQPHLYSILSNIKLYNEDIQISADENIKKLLKDHVKLKPKYIINPKIYTKNVLKSINNSNEKLNELLDSKFILNKYYSCNLDVAGSIQCTYLETFNHDYMLNYLSYCNIYSMQQTPNNIKEFALRHKLTIYVLEDSNSKSKTHCKIDKITIYNIGKPNYIVLLYHNIGNHVAGINENKFYMNILKLDDIIFVENSNKILLQQRPPPTPEAIDISHFHDKKSSIANFNAGNDLLQISITPMIYSMFRIKQPYIKNNKYNSQQSDIITLLSRGKVPDNISTIIFNKLNKFLKLYVESVSDDAKRLVNLLLKQVLSVPLFILIKEYNTAAPFKIKSFDENICEVKNNSTGDAINIDPNDSINLTTVTEEIFRYSGAEYTITITAELADLFTNYLKFDIKPYKKI